MVEYRNVIENKVMEYQIKLSFPDSNLPFVLRSPLVVIK